MDTKHIHCMLEKIAEYGKCMMEEAVGAGNVNLEDASKIVDMVKDLACAEKDALIAKETRKAHEEDESEEKYFLKMLKEEYKDEYKRMRDEYGEGEETDKRFYDSWRHADGSFAKKGTGKYRPKSYGRRGRRGYEEMPYMMMPEMYNPMRDLDREEMGRMYYSGGGNSSGGSTGGNAGGQAGGMSGGNMSGSNGGGSSRGYSDGYDEGQRRGYTEGYEQGNRDGRRSGGNSRYEKAKRGYEETKEMHKGNTPEDKRMNMTEFEKVLNIVLDEIDDMLEDAPPEMKNMAKTKGIARLQKIQ